MKPLVDIPLSAVDHRRILYWARMGAMHAITEVETELARHLTLAGAGADDPVPNRFGGQATRQQCIDALRGTLAKFRSTFERLAEIEASYRDADNERAGREIAQSVLAARADDRRAAEAKRVVGEG